MTALGQTPLILNLDDTEAIRYAKTRAGVRKATPDKNEYSHIVDALQYACLAAHGGQTETMARHMLGRPRFERKRFTAAAWT